MSYVLYGIPNCDTIKKAKAWLNDHDITYRFHNYKKDGIDATKLQSWFAQEPILRIVNKAGTTYRKLTDEDKKKLEDETFVIKVLQEQPSMIKRPILELDNVIVSIGFKPDLYEDIFR